MYAVALVVFSSIISSFGTIFYRQAILGLGPITSICFLNIIGGVLLCAYLRARNRLPSLEALKEARRDLILLTILRTICGGLIFAHGLEQTESIKVIFFTKIEPYFILFWYWLLRGSKVNTSHLLLLSLHVAGAFLLSTNGSFEFGAAQQGDVLVLIAMLVFALSYVYGTASTNTLGAIQANALSSLIGGLAILPFSLLFSEPGTFSLSNEGWGHLVFVALLFQVFGLTLWYVTLGLMEGWMVSALRSLGPVIVAPFAWVLFGETLSFLQMASAMVVILTSSLIAKEHMRRKTQDAA